MFWLRKGSVSGHPDGTINLLHYEDAASAALSVLDFKQTSNSMIHNDVKASTKESNVSNEQGVVFLACDDNPVKTRPNNTYQPFHHLFNLFNSLQ